MAYTNIPKPSGTTNTNINPIGKIQYDQADVTYSSASVFYDGIDEAMYTDINKPSGTSYTNINKPV